MRPGVIPYWSCGGEVLTRALDSAGRLVARPVPADDAARLIDFHRADAEAAALRRALAAAAAWRRAAVGACAV